MSEHTCKIFNPDCVQCQLESQLRDERESREREQYDPIGRGVTVFELLDALLNLPGDLPVLFRLGGEDYRPRSIAVLDTRYFMDGFRSALVLTS